jgi:5-methylcytosine-specific restriction endonuclease McrA
MKRCTKCGQEKPLDDFERLARSPDGYNTQCKACKRAYFRTWLNLHREEQVAKGTAYYQEHREELCLKAKEYRQAHSESVRAKDKARRAQNKLKYREQRRRYYRANCERLKANQQAYHSDHREEATRYVTKYQAEHKAELAAYHAAYREAHRDEHRAYDLAHYQQVREQRLAYRKEYRETHRDQVRANNNLRKARQRNAPIADLTGAQWEQIKASYRGRCAYCGKPTDNLTMDHVVPLARGGAHTASNIVPACLTCNMRKKVGPPPPFQPVLPALLS